MISMKRKSKNMEMIRYSCDGKLERRLYTKDSMACAWGDYESAVRTAVLNQAQEMIILKDQTGIVSSFFMAGRNV